MALARLTPPFVRNHPIVRSRVRPILTSVVLLVGDLLALFLAALAAFWVRGLVIGPLELSAYLPFWPAITIVPIAYAYSGLYPGYGVGPVDQLRHLARSTTLVALLVVASSYFFKVGANFSRGVFLGWWLMGLMLVPMVRAGLKAILVRTEWWGQPLLILGAAKTGEVVAHKLRNDPSLGLRPVACLDDDPHKEGTTCAGVPVVGPLRLATELAHSHGIRMAVIAMPGLGRSRLLRVVEEHAATFPQILIIPDLLGITSLWVSARDLQGVLGLELRQNLLSRWNRFLKRMIDLGIAVPLLLLAGPVILLLGWLVTVFSPGSPFYFQEREGLSGRRIKVWKLRTMVPNAEEVLHGYLDRNPLAKAEWDQFMKLREDPRVVQYIGSFLRRFSLDELPQLWNIVKGEMSLVGPRPFPEYHLSRFPPVFQVLRRQVVPGLTGLWQVTARSDGDLIVQQELDTYYIRNWSLWLDVYLLARTAAVVLFGKGAY